MLAEYGEYVYNQRLFHLNDAGIMSEYDLMWDYELHRRDLGKRQARVRGRAAVNFFCGLVLLAVGGAATAVNFVPCDYGDIRPAYEVRPFYATAVLMVTGIILCLLAVFLLSCIGEGIIFHERGFKRVDFFGLHSRTVLYQDIKRIEKHRICVRGNTLDSYMIYTDGKTYNWTGAGYIGAAEITDLLLYRCFRKIPEQKAPEGLDLIM